MNTILKAILTFASLMAFLNVSAQDATPLSHAETDRLITGLTAQLSAIYFNQEKASTLNELLREKLQTGDFYDQPADALALELTKFLRDQTHDLHFYVRQRKPTQASPAGKRANDPDRQYNGGFTEVKLLPHNIGYIKWMRCLADEDAFKRILSALTFLEGCDYLIVDISDNPGGDGRSGGFINQFLYQQTDYQDLLLKRCKGEEDWHQSEVPYNYTSGPKFFGVPLYIITTEHTGSASEYFAFVAQQTKRGTILGRTTAGAGNPVAAVSIGHWEVHIPTCEIKTRDGKSLEAKGVIPDVPLKSGDSDLVNETIEYIRRENKL